MSGCELDIRWCGSVAATDTRAAGKGTYILVISYCRQMSDGLNLLLKCIQSKKERLFAVLFYSSICQKKKISPKVLKRLSV